MPPVHSYTFPVTHRLAAAASRSRMSPERAASPRLRRLKRAGVVHRKAADRGPIKVFTAPREQPQKSVAQETTERHGHAQRFGGSQGKTDVLEPEWCGESCRLKLVVGDEGAVGLVRRRGKNGRRQ